MENGGHFVLASMGMEGFFSKIFIAFKFSSFNWYAVPCPWAPKVHCVFWDKLAVARDVAGLCDCLVVELYLCMAVFAVNKSLKIFRNFIVSLFVQKINYVDFSMSLTRDI